MPRSRGRLANLTPMTGVGHLISEPKFKIPPPPPPLLISDKSLNNPCWLANRHVQLENPVRNYYQIKTMLRATFKNW